MDTKKIYIFTDAAVKCFGASALTFYSSFFCEYIYRYWALENLSLSLQNSSRSGFLSFISQLLGKNNRNKITTLRKVRFFLVSFKLRHLHIEKDSVTCLIWSTFRWQLKYTTHRYENQTGDHQRFQFVHCTFSACVACFVLFLAFRVRSAKRDLTWTLHNAFPHKFPVDLPPPPPTQYVSRAYTAGSPKRLLVRYTIPSLFISAYVPSCVCVNSLALHVMRAFSHKLLSLLPLHSLWAQHNHHINPVHSVKETRTRGEKNPKGNMARWNQPRPRKKIKTIRKLKISSSNYRVNPGLEVEMTHWKLGHKKNSCIGPVCAL